MASKKEWSKDETTELIGIYEESSVLWNSKSKEYRNRVLKDKVLNDISMKFNCTAEEVQRKLHNLRNQVSQELKKIKSKKSGAGTDDNYLSNWPYFKALKFLIPALSANETKSSLSRKTTEQSTINVIEAEQFPEIPNSSMAIVQNVHGDKNPTERKRRTKRKLPDESDENENLFKEAMKVLQKVPDDDDRFGQYVAMELKGLRSEQNKKRLKTQIRKAIVSIVEEEDNLYAETSSSSTFMPTSTSSLLFPVGLSSSCPIQQPEEDD